MSKTEIALIVLVAVILLLCVWFILSDHLWQVVSFIETLLYPDINAPQ